MQLKWSDLNGFNENNVRNLVLIEGGVYRIYIKMTDGKYKVIYVGSAENLQKRLLEHLSTTEQNSKLKNMIERYITAFRFTYLSSESDRKNIEYTLFHHFKPECNENEPEGTYIDINII